MASSAQTPTSASSAPAFDLAGQLDHMVLYQIYPQSYADSNGDGIGDLPGITARLDYLKWLGVDAIWLSPCFASPFVDAGYDVSDYCQIAPRYGTNEDLTALTEQAAQRGIAVVLDLVAGHTSDTHPWFQASANDADDDRYIWRENPGEGWVAGPGTRGMYYQPNFYDCQPALNFGYARMDPSEPWRQPVDAPGPAANRAALREIMSYWFDRGVSGFRVDMAASLVKDDADGVETGKLWTQMRAWIEQTYPGRLLVSEWGNPKCAVPAGFHSDFFLPFGGRPGVPLRTLWNNDAGTVEDGWGHVPCWADARGKGDAAPFVDAWRQAADAIEAAGHGGAVGLPTSNHDFSRLVCGDRDREQAKAAFVFELTWPIMPSVYYGDEIGMRFLPEAVNKEGSRLSETYDRAGSRTPMQWGELGEAFAGAAHANVTDSAYLPQDSAADRPTVADQWQDPDSLLNHVRTLIALRHQERRLDVSAGVEVLTTSYPFAFIRGGTLLVATNPSDREVELDLSGVQFKAGRKVVLASGAQVGSEMLTLAGFGYAVIDLAE